VKREDGYSVAGFPNGHAPPMPVTLSPADDRFFTDAPLADFSFVVDTEFEPAIARPVDMSPRRTVPAWRKAYGFDAEACRGHVDAPDRMLCVARRGDALAGYVAVAAHWNGFALVEDIAVAVAHRRRGVASTLLHAAEDWARGRGLPGLMLETQNNNVAACRLYERHGFVLRGVDAWLYRGLDANTREIALFYYLDLSPP